MTNGVLSRAQALQIMMDGPSRVFSLHKQITDLQKGDAQAPVSVASVKIGEKGLQAVSLKHAHSDSGLVGEVHNRH